jgi:hypothetical protein
MSTRRRDLKLDKYEISSNAYRELLYFCQQYRENKEKLRVLENLSATKLTAMPKGGDVGNPTEVKAMKAARVRSDCELIENIAHAVVDASESGEIVYACLIKNVTENGYPYEVLNAPAGKLPIGKNQFYKLRRMFFYYLAIEKGKI